VIVKWRARRVDPLPSRDGKVAVREALAWMDRRGVNVKAATPSIATMREAA
jgi:hypothetical protein